MVRIVVRDAFNWWTFGVEALAACATTVAAAMAVVSARAARDAANIMREERRAAERESRLAPLRNLAAIVNQYLGTQEGHEGHRSAKTLQADVRRFLTANGLEPRLPKTSEFAHAATNELLLALQAQEELRGVIASERV